MVLRVLAGQPLLVLFVVVAVGYLAGKVRIAGFGLGVAGVLFTGIAAGAVDPRLRLPEIVYLLGLALFVYTVGLSAGPGFASSLRRAGLRWNALAVGGILAVGAAVAVLGRLLDFGGATQAGLFAGMLTNTPALAAVVERLGGTPDADLPVIAYSMAYPASVISCLAAIAVLQRMWRIDYAADAVAAGMAAGQIVNATAEVRHPLTVASAVRASGGRALIGRIRHHEYVGVAEPSLRLERGDRVTVVGSAEAVDAVTRLVGQPYPDRLDADRTDLEVRRIFVSNPRLVGQRIAGLDLAGRFEAIITRVRRGDVDSLADPGIVLELGDRVRVVAPPQRMKELSRFFGDSYKELGEVNIASLALGLTLGLLLGTVSIPLPGEGSFSIGLAGGTLVAGLLLGARRRTGPLVWQLPAGVNLSLRQLGLVLFLAGIGTRAGQSFAATIVTADGWLLLVLAFGLCLPLAFGVLMLGHRVLGLSMGVVTGVLAGMCTQPATLVFADEQAENELPELGYTTVFPAAMIIKIVIAQLLLGVF